MFFQTFSQDWECHAVAMVSYILLRSQVYGYSHAARSIGFPMFFEDFVRRRDLQWEPREDSNDSDTTNAPLTKKHWFSNASGSFWSEAGITCSDDGSIHCATMWCPFGQKHFPMLSDAFIRRRTSVSYCTVSYCTVWYYRIR